MKWLKTIEDFVAHAFSNKERAAIGRLLPFTSESPAECFNKACQLIADKLNLSGFRYSPSQHKLQLESPDNKYVLNIKFSSNRDNVAGQYVELSAEFYIVSKELRKFSKAYPLLSYWNDYLLGKDFGGLIEGGKGKVAWNLAEPEDLANALNTIPEVTQSKLMAIFEQLQDRDYVAREIENSEFSLVTPVATVQYLLMINRKDLAERFLAKILSRSDKKIVEDYLNSKATFAQDGLPAEFVHGFGHGYEIALLEKVYGLHIVVSKDK